MPAVITLKDGCVSFGGEPVFQGITFSIEEHDKICLVGRNGCGKSTLLKLIAGIFETDGGEFFVQPGSRIGYLPQKVEYDKNQTVYDYVLSGITQKDESEGDLKYHADIIMGPLDLDGNAKLGEMSGGQQRRASLARAMIDRPHLLLLDEPTNHLDIGAISWLEKYLNSYRGALLCISHDREFLKNITGRTLWMDQGRILSNGKGYADFERWSDAVMQQELAHIQKLGKKVDRENDWLHGGISARRKRNVRRLGELFRLRDKLRNDKHSYLNRTGKIKLPPLKDVDKSKLVVEMFDIKKSFGDIKIINDFSTRIMKGDRIGLIGKNGSGKSTFIKMMIGEINEDAGEIRRGFTQSKFLEQLTYFDQYRNELDPTKTMWETMCPTGGDYVEFEEGQKHVVGYLKNFMFKAEQVRNPVSILSGGEANRLMLAKKLAKPGSILILDEPTNDLDLETLDMLQEVLCDYKGTLIIVSHDRDFIDRVVTKTIVFEGDGVVEEYIGGYSDYVEEKNKRLNRNNRKAPQTIEVTKETPKENKPVKKLLYKHKLALERLPGEIEQLNSEIQQLNKRLHDSDLYNSDPDLFFSMTSDLAKKKESLSQKEAEWLEVELLREEIDNN